MTVASVDQTLGFGERQIEHVSLWLSGVMVMTEEGTGCYGGTERGHLGTP